MNTIKKPILFILLISIASVEAKDYFNPLFLGDDVASIENLSYLTNGNDIIPGNYNFGIYIGDSFLTKKNISLIEDKTTKKIVPCFNNSLIEELPIKESIKKEILDRIKKNDECININEYLSPLQYNINVPDLKLELSIAQIYLDQKKTNLARRKDWDDGITALITNYTILGSNVREKKSGLNSSSYYLSLYNKLNFGAWRLSNDIYWAYSKYGSNVNNEYHINNIALYRNIPSIDSILTIGQSSLGSSIFQSYSYRGINIHNESMMVSENERGYAPNIKGILNSKSRVTIRQNGNIIYENYLDAGPYNIDDLYPNGNNGDYEVEIVSLDGKVDKFIVPYSSLPDMLKEGRYNYNLTLGNTENNGNVKFLQSDFSYGLRFKATVNSGIQLSNNYKSQAVGISKDIGYLGALSFDATNSIASINSKKYNGQSYRFLYSKSLIDLGTTLRLIGYRYSTSGFYSFDESNRLNHSANISHDDYYSNYHRKSSFQANINQSLGKYGQLYAWGIVTNYWHGKSNKNIQLGWNKTLSDFYNVTINTNISHYKYLNGNSENIYFINFSIPLKPFFVNTDNLMYASNSMNYHEETKSFTNVNNIYGTAYNSKINYNMSYSSGNKMTKETAGANIVYNGNKSKLNMGAVYSQDLSQLNYGINGSLVTHSGGVTFANQISDNAVLIEAKGAEGAKVGRLAKNLYIDDFGYAVVPYATPYAYNEIELDPSSFGDNYNIENKVLKTVPTKGAITKVSFNVEKGYNFLARVNYKNNPIRFGSVVKNIINDNTFIANDDGTVYLSGVNDGTTFIVQWDKNSSCKFTINLPNNFKPSVVNKLETTCQ